jgi:ZIP family zinc transporter
MSGLLSPDVLVALGVSASAGLTTVLGGLFVLRMDKTNSHHLAIALAFAGGAMVYISLVEIFPKSAASLGEVHGANAGYAWTTLAFFDSIGLLVLLDRLVPNPHPDVAATSQRDKAAVARMSLLTAAAITAHNLPEGLATFFATLDDPAVGASLAIAIALHNIPEGVSVAVPVYYATGSRSKAVLASQDGTEMQQPPEAGGRLRRSDRAPVSTYCETVVSAHCTTVILTVGPRSRVVI